jgi:two-component system, cell cycle response regulator DivK
LIVDDHAISLEVLSDLLSFYGAGTLTAQDGRKAYDIAVESLPTLVITDLSMPVASGWDLINMLQSNTATQHIPIVALSGHALTEYREQAISKGVQHYLLKPIDPFTFIDKIVTIIESIPELSSDLAARLQR